MRIIRENRDLAVHWVVLSAEGERAAEARASADRYLSSVARKEVRLDEFRNSFFPYTGSEIKDCFESLKESVDPDLILTHYRGDLHQDHRLCSELTWNTFRRHSILEYEIPKFDGDLGAPNAFVTLSEIDLAEKVNRLHSYFPSQRDKPWFDESVFRSLCRLRGMECNSPTGLAEAFYFRKLVLV
jgi:LmbE family N-acetylglucosaminyl deacetylase